MVYNHCEEQEKTSFSTTHNLTYHSCRISKAISGQLFCSIFLPLMNAGPCGGMSSSKRAPSFSTCIRLTKKQATSTRRRLSSYNLKNRKTISSKFPRSHTGKLTFINFCLISTWLEKSAALRPYAFLTKKSRGICKTLLVNSLATESCRLADTLAN